jgi:CheY-like chemotaxis protein
VYDENGDFLGRRASNWDITDQKQAEKETEIQLKKKDHDSLIAVLNSLDAHIYVVDINSYEILFMNKKMIEDFNADFVGDKCYKSFQKKKSPCSIGTNHQLLDKNKELTGVHTWQCSNPITNQWYINYGWTINWVDGRSARIQIAMDITAAKNNEEERKQMEQQLLQAQKLEAIGTLSGGIAHDFNNLLMGIQGRASLMEIDLEYNHPCREHVEVIMECSRNATELTSQLLGVARGGKCETKGTTFNVYLPVSDQKVKEEATMDQKLIAGSETILLVDDESIVINVCKEMIEKLGYDVITAKSGKQAVDTFREKSEDIDLIIPNMIMPGMDDDQTFDQLREINSSIPILLSSGYSLNGQAKKIMEKGCNGFIQKPFLITQLSEKIQNILDEN